VLFFVTEGPGQAAAAGVKVDHLRAGKRRNKRNNGLHPDQGALMTVGLHEDLFRRGPASVSGTLSGQAFQQEFSSVRQARATSWALSRIRPGEAGRDSRLDG